MLRQITHAARAVAGVIIFAAFAIGCGESNGGTGGTAGNGGNGGTGGSDGVAVVAPQCVSSAYQVLFRGFVQPLDPLLRYLDTPVGAREPSQLPDISGLSELKDVEGVYSRFTWNANDVPGVTDTTGAFIVADFVESTGANPVNLDNGISNQQVVLVPWQMTVDESTLVGEGKLSVIGLGEDTVRITIVDFNPWYENLCRFEVSSFNLQLDLATPGSEPFAVVIGYSAEGPAYTIENGSIIFGEGDTASFTGDFRLGGGDPIPFDFELDYSTDPAGITGTFGGATANCTIDLGTFAVAC